MHLESSVSDATILRVTLESSFTILEVYNKFIAQATDCCFQNYLDLFLICSLFYF
jgi:hypothetical protein